jgi:hypothetical protein
MLSIIIITVTLLSTSFQIQGQQFLQNLLIIQIRLPPIRGKDGFIESFMGERTPL